MIRLSLNVALAASLISVPLTAQTPPASTPAAPATPAPPACAAPEHRQFDFWVGRWDVSQTGQTQVIARSLIERLFADCVIRETWMPLSGGGGSSLNTYQPAQRRWRQLWADSSNGWVSFEGGIEGGAMVLTGAWTNADGSPNLTRMTYTRNPDGSVRQAGSVSNDGGQTWTPNFDFTYRRAAGN